MKADLCTEIKDHVIQLPRPTPSAQTVAMAQTVAVAVAALPSAANETAPLAAGCGTTVVKTDRPSIKYTSTSPLSMKTRMSIVESEGSSCKVSVDSVMGGGGRLPHAARMPWGQSQCSLLHSQHRCTPAALAPDVTVSPGTGGLCTGHGTASFRQQSPDPAGWPRTAHTHALHFAWLSQSA